MHQKVITAALALAVGIVAGVLIGGTLMGGEDEVNFVLKPRNGACAFDWKQDAYVLRGNNLKFRFRNDCSNEVRVAMGNVRTEREGGGENCQNATVRDTAWPFRDADAQPEKRTVTVGGSSKGQFTLHGARNPGEYYFDVCLDGTVLDPRLWLE